MGEREPETEKDRSRFIRPAGPGDASRIAEILVFSKRTHYRAIFHDDDFSFGELQVLPAALRYRDHPETLAGILVFDDGFVKGMIRLDGDEIAELYVDPFFEGQGIGSVLMAEALRRILRPRLWVLEKNDTAAGFYRKHGFVFSGVREQQENTPEFKAEMVYAGRLDPVIGKTVRVTVDRPVGSRHPAYPDLVYPVNYGYVEGVPGGDGEWQDVYILGTDTPLSEFTGTVKAVIRRTDDVEDKWVAAPETVCLTEEEIREKTDFQEKFFHTAVVMRGC